MKTLHIEWKHLDKGGRTCERCAETGAALRRVIDNLTGDLAARGIRVAFTETRLSEREISQSNSILFNGVPLQDLLPEVRVIDNHCDSCSGLCDQDTACRAIQVGGTIYEAIPESMLRQAALKAAGVQAALPVLNEPAEACCKSCS